MKSTARLTIVACAFAIAGCADHSSQPHNIVAATLASSQPALDAHDDLIIEMLAHFDFGDGMTLANMSDEEFDDTMSKGDQLPATVNQDTPPTRAEYLMRQARLRAVEESSAPPQSPRTTQNGK